MKHTLDLTFTPDGRYACPGLGLTLDLALSDLGLDPVLAQHGCEQCPIFHECEMSHWTKMDVAVSDAAALQAAAAELGLVWQVGGEARGYAGQRMKADFVLKTPAATCRYDIAAVRDPKTGLLSLTTDWWGGDVAKHVGTAYGKLLQHYGIAKAHLAARAKGFTTTRKTQPNGNIVLTIQMP